jgi:hypothetical protein
MPTPGAIVDTPSTTHTKVTNIISDASEKPASGSVGMGGGGGAAGPLKRPSPVSMREMSALHSQQRGRPVASGAPHRGQLRSVVAEDSLVTIAPLWRHVSQAKR